MQINRNTYEEFFLLYNDGELTLEEQKAVEDFVKENPDLEHELILLQGTVFSPDENIVFEHKDSLYREERKVVPFGWFRIAAAAVVVIALTTFGWLFLDANNQSDQPQAVASKELVRQELKNVDEVQQVEPTITTVSEQVPSPAEIVTTVKEKKVSVTLTVNNTKTPKERSGEEKMTVSDQPTVRFAEETEPDHSELTHDLAISPQEKDVIDVAVAPVHIARNTTAASVTSEQTVEYVETGKDNMIYFANTSLPKKSKLRGVFRKATRILDKVTSFQ